MLAILSVKTEALHGTPERVWQFARSQFHHAEQQMADLLVAVPGKVNDCLSISTKVHDYRFRNFDGLFSNRGSDARTSMFSSIVSRFCFLHATFRGAEVNETSSRT